MYMYASWIIKNKIILNTSKSIIYLGKHETCRYICLMMRSCNLLSLSLLLCYRRIAGTIQRLVLSNSSWRPWRDPQQRLSVLDRIELREGVCVCRSPAA